MRFATFAVDTALGPVERVGVAVDGGRLLDLNATYAGLLRERVEPGRAQALADAVVPTDLVALLGNGSVATDAVAEALDADEGAAVHHLLDDVHLLAPLPRPASLRDCSAFEAHVVATAGPDGPNKLWYEFPTYYKGNVASVQGTDTDVLRPHYTNKLDYELEFAVVIGRRGRDIAEDDALDHVAGYTVFNDVSARDIQFREMRMWLGPAKGKDLDGGNVLGPFLVTPDEFDPTADNAMTAHVDGELWSEGSTSTLYHSVARIISHISQAETLHAGDVIGSGTVGGGCGLEQGRYPAMGSTVELTVEGIGTLRNRFIEP
jgi:2-keto-4-pentenoate hydratase/2-oxohepta-3-ene-1,7-dioic acid hydratase in catechol pathway